MSADLENFLTWFWMEAEALAPEQRDRVNAALTQDNHRIVFLHLDELSKDGRLPTAWSVKLDEFYSRFF